MPTVPSRTRQRAPRLRMPVACAPSSLCCAQGNLFCPQSRPHDFIQWSAIRQSVAHDGLQPTQAWCRYWLSAASGTMWLAQYVLLLVGWWQWRDALQHVVQDHVHHQGLATCQHHPVPSPVGVGHCLAGGQRATQIFGIFSPQLLYSVQPGQLHAMHAASAPSRWHRASDTEPVTLQYPPVLLPFRQSCKAAQQSSCGA